MIVLPVLNGIVLQVACVAAHALWLLPNAPRHLVLAALLVTAAGSWTTAFHCMSNELAPACDRHTDEFRRRLASGVATLLSLLIASLLAHCMNIDIGERSATAALWTITLLSSIPICALGRSRLSRN